MACWRGVCRLCRGSSSNASLTDALGADTGEICIGEGQFAPVKTWDVPPPSRSYLLPADLEQSGRQAGKAIPPDLLDDMQRWKQDLLAEQAATKRRAELPHLGPEEPPTVSVPPLIITEEGTGHKRPEKGCKVCLSYAAVLRDESVLDMCHNFEYNLGSGERGAGQVTSTVLESVLVQMRCGQVASFQCTVGDIFPAEAPACHEHALDAPAVLEVRLLEIHSKKDCSFDSGAGDVIREVIGEGVGAWCDNPTDEGMAELCIEEVKGADGTRTFPADGSGPLTVRVTPGNGEVCDALECGMLEMRKHETALVTCSDPMFCCGGAPFRNREFSQGATFRVKLMDFAKGPDVFSFDEEDRYKFALRRKAQADILFKQGRFRLARERYRRIIELFHHMDKKYSRDRFMGRPELLECCKKLRSVCRLNAAACSIRLSDPWRAIELCNAVLWCEPENTKALYRRSQAQVQRENYSDACNDLERLLDIDGGIEEAKSLWKRAAWLRDRCDRQQRKSFNFNRMIDNMRSDPRTIQHDYMDTPVDFPGIDGPPISARWKPRK